MANPPPSDEESPSARTAKLLRSILTEEPPPGETGQASAAAEPLLPDVDSGPIVADPPPGSAVEWIDAVAEAVKEADERMSRELSAARGRVLIAEERARQAEERARVAEEEAREAEGRIDAAEQRVREADGRIDAAEQRAREAEARAEQAEASLRHLYEALENQADAAHHAPAGEGGAEAAGAGPARGGAEAGSA